MVRFHEGRKRAIKHLDGVVVGIVGRLHHRPVQVVGAQACGKQVKCGPVSIVCGGRERLCAFL
jgi:hypothetical protein